MHTEKHELAGQTVKIKKEVTHFQYPDFGGSEFVIEDWQDRAFDKSWMDCKGNPACVVYALRSAGKTPTDDEVVCGHTKDNLGHLVHVSEIE